MWCVVTSFFIPALQNATFAAKNTAVSHKIVKVSNFPPVFTRFLLFLSSPVFERYDTEAKISNFLPFVCLFVKLDTYLAYLSPISLYSNDMTPISRNLKKHLFSFIFKIYFVCLLGCFPYFLKFSLFVCLLSSFLPFFLPPVKRTIIFVNFFSNFQGFTLVPWQKVGRIGLGFAQNAP